MSEQLTSNESSIEKKTTTYNSVSEYLSAFEKSPVFEAALSDREKELKTDKSDVNLSRQELIAGMRMVPSYRLALIDFFHEDNLLNNDLKSYGKEIQTEIKNYWDFIESMPTHIQTIRSLAKDKEDEEVRLFRMEKTRDRLHTLAGLAFLGNGIQLEDGELITCIDIEPDNESAMDLESYSVLGRSLVSILTEENQLDIADPLREEKKTEATLDFLNGCHYSSGHWVAKGER